MDFEEQHSLWMEQIDKLVKSKSNLSNTNQNSILSNFFSQAIDSEFTNDLNFFKQQMKDIIVQASKLAPTLNGTIRQRAVHILRLNNQEEIFNHIRLSDIRNTIVFGIYRRGRVAIETYFERYSSPPGSVEQNEVYLSVAHGTAKCTAVWTEKLHILITKIAILKRFFLVYDIYTENNSIELNSMTLNWVCTQWLSHIQQINLADLVWDIFLDLWTYVQSVENQ
tara:strand:+ start:1796 stop:2467 length:672 start_codon:yes stop_codon:yes gene_type:complete